MAGGTIEHGALALAVAGELRAALRGKPCRAFSSDVRVRIPETDLATYPDLSMVCGQLETAPDDKDAITNPIVLVEVLLRLDRGLRPGGEGGPLPAHLVAPRVRARLTGRSPASKCSGGRRAAAGSCSRPARARRSSSCRWVSGWTVAAVYANPLDQAARE